MEDFYNNLLSMDFKGKAALFAADVSEFFKSADWKEIFAGFKSVLAIFSVVMLFLIIIMMSKLMRLRGGHAIDESKAPVIKKGEFTKRWEELIQKSKSSNISDWKVVVIEIDKIFDDLLKRMGYAGDGMGDRLKQLNRAQFPDLDDIWEVHKIRNRIVHNPNYEISKPELDFVLKTYEKVLRGLGGL